MSATVIQFPTVYRIAYSNGEQIGLVEDSSGLAITFRRIEKAEAALHLLRAQHPSLFFWVTSRPNS